MLLLRKFVVVCHRWTGVLFCLLFAWWFLSGIFMVYWSYPEVRDANRLQHAQPLDFSRVRISPAQAFHNLKDASAPDAVKLVMFDARPAYRFEFGGASLLVYADTGAPQDDFPPALNLRTAASWAHQAASFATAAPLSEEDQWTVALFRDAAPITKYSWPDGQQVYISDPTGEVVQYTTRASRLEAYLGAIPHWLYFTPLRKNGLLWSRIVTWASGLATLVALLGIIVGLWMYSPSRRYKIQGEPSGIPYLGWKRLHMQLGLFFGILACTWTFSGMLSMDPFPSLAALAGSDRTRSLIDSALHSGDPLDPAFATLPPATVIAQLGPDFHAKELEFASLLGQPAYIARPASGPLRVIPVRGSSSGNPLDAIRSLVERAIAPGHIAGARLLTQYDAHYLDRTGQKPLPVLRFEVSTAPNSAENAQHSTGDSAPSLYYVDPLEARVVGVYNPRSWPTRWLYHGLHSLDFPWLYNHRPAWDIVVLALLLGGAALSTTSVLIATQLLRRKLSPPAAPRLPLAPSTRDRAPR